MICPRCASITMLRECRTLPPYVALWTVVRAASTIVWSILEIVIFFSCEAFPPSSPKGGTVDNHA